MVFKTDNARECILHINIDGAEAEYLAILKALSIAIGCIDGNSEAHIDARKTISLLLIGMLPFESGINLSKINY